MQAVQWLRLVMCSKCDLLGALLRLSRQGGHVTVQWQCHDAGSDPTYVQGCVQLPESPADNDDNAAAADLRDCFAPAVAHSDTFWHGCLDRY